MTRGKNSIQPFVRHLLSRTSAGYECPFCSLATDPSPVGWLARINEPQSSLCYEQPFRHQAQRKGSEEIKVGRGIFNVVGTLISYVAEGSDYLNLEDIVLACLFGHGVQVTLSDDLGRCSYCGRLLKPSGFVFSLCIHSSDYNAEVPEPYRIFWDILSLVGG